MPFFCTEHDDHPELHVPIQLGRLRWLVAVEPLQPDLAGRAGLAKPVQAAVLTG
jgi:hypothetical protein